MALNKYMHPRNIYKVPPDFAKLAKTNSEFSSITKMDVTGKLTINFKDAHTLRILTKCLLKSDFNLDVEIPEDRLVPTLPLRLNYILWLEDLLNSMHRTSNVYGIDIGTGACVIYPLLAATKNKWHMVATETDEESFQKASANVERNNLQDFIQLVKNTTNTVIEHLFNNNEEIIYDFCMCNPPFYSSFQELFESRSPARPPPKNGFTGSPQELITEGGELTFCRKMINESKNYKDKVIMFTTMVGHKYNLKELILDLKSEGMKHTSTEFCQGRVTRWGLAWTYQDYDVNKLVPPRDKQPKKIPITCPLPDIPNMPVQLETAVKKLYSILDDLKITHKVMCKRATTMSLGIKAAFNTWSNQRRKRRLLKRLNETEVKKQKLTNEVSEVLSENQTKLLTTSNMSIPVNNNSAILSKACVSGNVTASKIKAPETITSQTTIRSEITTLENNNIQTPTINIDTINASQNVKEDPVHKTNKLIESSDVNKFLVHAIAKILVQDKIILEFEYIDGTLGKEGLHQIIQYIKNNWK